MDPIPLSAPDGTIYAHACSYCRKVVHTGEYGRRYGDVDVALFAAESKSAAERCCKCGKCGLAAHYSERPHFDTCAACWEGGEKQKYEAHLAELQVKQEANLREREASLSRAVDRDSALYLEHRMRDISEDTWCAGWLVDLEYVLWEWLGRQEDEIEMGRSTLTRLEREELLRLAERAGGWWTYDRFVPMAEWLKRYEDRPRRGGE